VRARRFPLPATLAALTLGLATLATPALAEGPTPAPADHAPAYVSIEEGPGLSFPRELGIALRYSCYGDPTTVEVTVTAGAAKASGSKAIPCQGETDLPVGLGLTVPEDAPGFPPGVYLVEIRASIPGQASLVTTSKVEGPPALAPVFVAADAKPEEVVKGKKITIVGVIRRGSVGAPFAARTSLEFRPDGGDWRKLKSATSGEDGLLSARVRATRSGNFRFRYAGSSTNEPATWSPDHIVVRPKPKAYTSCAALDKVYKHGVGKPGAQDENGDVTTFTRDRKTYAKNKKLDRDLDGIACEKA
jgi:hypothetical protein